MLKWITEKKYYSICSIHRPPKEDCDLCKQGSWEYERLIQLSGFFCRHCYPIWFWYQNRRCVRK